MARKFFLWAIFNISLGVQDVPAMSPVTKTKKCPDCNGCGKQTCTTCNGEGEIITAKDGKPVKTKTKKKAAGK